MPHLKSCNKLVSAKVNTIEQCVVNVLNGNQRKFKTMSNVTIPSITTNPYKAVSFVQSSIEKALEKAGSLIAEIKYDGLRGNLLVQPLEGLQAKCEVFSRTSKILPSLSQFDYECLERWGKFLDKSIYPQGMMIDGELLVKGKSFQESSGILRRKTQLPKSELVVRVYAIVPLDIVKSGNELDVSNGLMHYHVDATVARLQEFFPEITWLTAERHDVFSLDELNTLYEEKRAEGNEGLVIKDPLDSYKRGKKTGWWKMKPEDTIDGTVQGVLWGTEGKANEGRVIGFEVLLENDVVVDVTGLTVDQMDEFTVETIINPDYYKGWAIQVKYMEMTEGGSLRHPSFDCWRGTEEQPGEKV